MAVRFLLDGLFWGCQPLVLMNATPPRPIGDDRVLREIVINWMNQRGLRGVEVSPSAVKRVCGGPLVNGKGVMRFAADCWEHKGHYHGRYARQQVTSYQQAAAIVLQPAMVAAGNSPAVKSETFVGSAVARVEN